MNTTITIVAAMVAVAAIVAYMWRKKTGDKATDEPEFIIKDLTVEETNGTLDFSKVVTYFKSLKLEKGKCVPFIAQADKLKVLKIDTATKTTKPCKLLAGVFDEKKNTMNAMKLFTSDEWDRQTKDVFGDEPLIVLS